MIGISKMERRCLWKKTHDQPKTPSQFITAASSKSCGQQAEIIKFENVFFEGYLEDTPRTIAEEEELAEGNFASIEQVGQAPIWLERKAENPFNLVLA